MSAIYVLCIVASALMHASYNVLMRRARGSEAFLFWMFFVATGLALGAATATGELHDIGWRHTPYVYGAALFYVGYQFLVAQCYKQGNVSALYPLTVLSHLFVPFWAALFLDERISLVTGLGIVITVLGAIAVKMDSFSVTEVRAVFQLSGRYAGAGLALAASLVYSVGAIFDKSRIAFFSTFTYLAIILTLMTTHMALLLFILRRPFRVHYAIRHWPAIVVGGVALLLSFLFFRIALRAISVSIAVPMRQCAVIFALILGVAVLREKFILSKALGALVIIAGITLINVGVHH